MRDRWGFEERLPLAAPGRAHDGARARAARCASADLVPVLQVRGIVFLQGGALHLRGAAARTVHHGKYAWLPLSDSFKDAYSTSRCSGCTSRGWATLCPARAGARRQRAGARRVGAGKVGRRQGLPVPPHERRKGGHTHAQQAEYALQGGGASHGVCRDHRLQRGA